jgi:hypothetical protein
MFLYLDAPGILIARWSSRKDRAAEASMRKPGASHIEGTNKDKINYSKEQRAGLMTARYYERIYKKQRDYIKKNICLRLCS